jgi:hypothetical protein
MNYGYRELTEEEKEKYPHTLKPIMTKDGTVEMIDTNYHGDINCYTSRGDKPLDLIVRFTHGTVEEIKDYTAVMQQIRKYY